MPANIAGFTLEVDGVDYASAIIPRLMNLSITEKLGGEADTLELSLSNHDGRLAPITRGLIAALSMGWRQGDDVVPGLIGKGRFLIDEVSKEGPPDVLRIRARSADLTGGFRKRRDKSWQGATLGAVIKDIAARQGLAAKIHPDLTGIALPSVEQSAKSDAAFMADLGKRFDAAATVKDQTLIFLPIGAATNASGQQLDHRTLTRAQNTSWRFTVADRENHDGAEASWHDKSAAKKMMESEGGAANPIRIKRSFASKAEAQQAAKAAARKASRGKFTFDFQMALGDPSIGAGSRIKLTGWDSEIDAVNWLVDEARHSIDASAGLNTSLQLVSLG